MAARRDTVSGMQKKKKIGGWSRLREWERRLRCSPVDRWQHRWCGVQTRPAWATCVVLSIGVHHTGCSLVLSLFSSPAPFFSISTVITFFLPLSWSVSTATELSGSCSMVFIPGPTGELGERKAKVSTAGVIRDECAGYYQAVGSLEGPAAGTRPLSPLPHLF